MLLAFLTSLFRTTTKLVVNPRHSVVLAARSRRVALASRIRRVTL